METETERHSANAKALEKIKPGMVRGAWRVIVVSYRGPWGYVLIKKGDAVTRMSPRGFIEM